MPSKKKVPEFDLFSFQASSARELETDRTFKQEPQKETTPEEPSWRKLKYRSEEAKEINNSETLKQFQSSQQFLNSQNLGISAFGITSLGFDNLYINEKISKIEEELSDNIRRRIELEKKLYMETQQKRETENQKYFEENNVKNNEEQVKMFVNMEKKSDKIAELLEPHSPEKNIQGYSSTGMKKSSQKEKKNNPISKPFIPNQLQIQKWLRCVTFPEVPSCNLEKVERECQEIYNKCEHSDIVYILMVVSFHLEKFHNVRKYFREIQMFKVFEEKSYWVACETEYILENYSTCLKLSEFCMKKLSDKFLYRFLFLQAKCYEKEGNFINSIVCWNQLIKIQNKIGEYYLERAMIYDKIGYHKEALSDYSIFAEIEPHAKDILKDKIFKEKNEMKRKEMVHALAKIS